MRLLPRPVPFAAIALGLSLTGAAIAPAQPAQSATALSLGVYLWNDPQAEPIHAQFISVAEQQAEIEIDSPDGTKSNSRTASPKEMALLTAAVQDEISRLSLKEAPQPATPYITVDWHFSNKTGYADGSATYALDKVPPAVIALQKETFGGTFKGEK